MLLTASWASDESACSPFYKNHSLQSGLSTDSVGLPYLGEEVKFGVASSILSQQAFMLKPTMHLPPATQAVIKLLAHLYNLHSVKYTSLELFNSEMKNCSDIRVMPFELQVYHKCHGFSNLPVGPRQTEGENRSI